MATKEERSKINVIVVDDSEFSRQTVMRIIDDAGYNAAGEASTAQEAIDVINSADAHIAILDIVMPDTNGIELAQLITENFDDLKIIMISSLTHEHLILESIGAGAVDFIAKPFNPQQLLDSIEKLEDEILQDM